MNESTHPNPEVLAAFVDGRLAGEARAEVLTHLDRCRDCYEVFAGTVRFQRQEEPRGQVFRISRLEAPQWVWWTAAAAAVVVLAVVAPVVWENLGVGGREGEGEMLLATAYLVEALGPAGAGSSADASGMLPEGSAFAGGQRPQDAFRAGVRLMDLAAAAHGRELEGTAGALEGLEHFFGKAGLDDALAYDLDAAREALKEGNARALERAVRGLEAGAEDALEPFYLALGKWAEAGRLAAASEEAEFFRSLAFTGFLEMAGEREFPGMAAHAVDRIEELTRRDLGPAELEELETIFGGLIARTV